MEDVRCYLSVGIVVSRRGHLIMGGGGVVRIERRSFPSVHRAMSLRVSGGTSRVWRFL